jgi:chromatin segregation and condensation protein Rec8/ScpA/Scc1 (kleisin family)
MKKILFAAAVLFLGYTNANAQYRPDRNRNQDSYQQGYDEYDRSRDRARDINYMQREAKEQIARGIHSGRLSPREASVLMREYDKIADMERRFTRRGHLSNKERRILTSDLERLMAQTNQMSSRRGDNWARDHRRGY